MILESIVTTADRDGRVNIAPMGPVVDERINSICLRPFATSQTFANLKETHRAVVHVTDDCLLLARAAIGKLDPAGLTEPIDGGKFHPLRDCCRWYAVETEGWTADERRPDVRCKIVESRRQRDFFGLNRGKHAVVEAAILATRVHLLSLDSISQQFEQLKPLVEKTGGPAEHTAFAMLEEYIAGAASKEATGS